MWKKKYFYIDSSLVCMYLLMILMKYLFDLLFSIKLEEK